MPPKAKYTKQQITDVAYELVRKQLPEEIDVAASTKQR